MENTAITSPSIQFYSLRYTYVRRLSSEFESPRKKHTNVLTKVFASLREAEKKFELNGRRFFQQIKKNSLKSFFLLLNGNCFTPPPSSPLLMALSLRKDFFAASLSKVKCRVLSYTY